ncbi:MAG: alpha/beta hydrolase [Spirochaetales bacterium]|nr:alpha/beta hydrolase [Spirochaetales bacterium]
MKQIKFKIDNIPSTLYGSESNKLYLYVHGKHGNKEEAKNFAVLAEKKGMQVLSFDLPEHGERKDERYECTAENGAKDLIKIHHYITRNYSEISLFASSLGAFFSLMAFQNNTFHNCLFLSPILDMKKLIENMMTWTNTTVEDLETKKKILTPFGETLSWDYYQYTMRNPILKWDSPTSILYGEKDNLTERKILDSFANNFNCDITIMTNGEHFFHTQEQLKFLTHWLKEKI